MSITSKQHFVIEFINELNSYPYTASQEVVGISIINNNSTTPMTVTLNTVPSVTIPIPAAGIYDDVMTPFNTVTHAGGTDFDIALKKA